MNIKRKVSYCFLLALQARSKHLHELLKHIKKQNYTVHFDLSASVHLGEPIHASLLRSITSNGNCQNAQRIRTIAYHCNLIPFNWAIYLCAIHLHSILCFEYTDSRSPMTKQAFHIKSVLLQTTIDSSERSIFVSDQLWHYIFSSKVRMTLLQHNID